MTHRTDRNHCPILLAVLSAVPLQACGGSSSDGAWRVERPGETKPTASPRRLSREDVSRPLWVDPDEELTLAPRDGARLELELARPRRSARPGAPGTVEVSFEHAGESTPLPAVLAAREPERAAWSQVTVDLSSAPAATGRLRVTVDGERLGSEWVASRPRVFQRRDAGERMNVLVITVDTLRADHLGCYGHDRPTSPRLDELASESIVFERAVSQASWTLPSYVSMLTALYPESHGIVHRQHRLGGGFVSFVELFAGAGYTTAAFVSGTFTDALWGFDQGFDCYDDLGMISADDADPTAPEAMRPAEQRVTAGAVTRRAMEWMDANRDRRFLLVAHYFDPHGDRVSHGGVSEAFEPRPVEVRMPLHTEAPGEAVARERALYEGEIAFTDRHIGELLDHLRRLGLADNTIVVVCADHGEELFDRNSVTGHGHSLFNELVHVPLFFRVPDARYAPSRIDRPVGNVDVFPTLAELCGIPFEPVSPGGESLVPLMRGEAEDRSAAVLSSRYAPGGGADGAPAPRDWIRVDRGDLCLIQVARGGRPMSFLFKWSEDVFQTDDLSQSRPRGVERMRALVESMQPGLQALHATKGAGAEIDLVPYLEALEGLGYAGEDADD